jgi:prolipoprotein diacylglyceryltransferase
LKAASALFTVTLSSSRQTESEGFRFIARSLFEPYIVFLPALSAEEDRLKGRLLYLYLLIYSAMRFVIEFWRGDSYRGFILGLSTSQFIGIFLFVFALIIIFRKRKNTYAG